MSGAVTKRRVAELLEGFLSGRSPHTQLAYQRDLDVLVDHLSRQDTGRALPDPRRHLSMFGAEARRVAAERATQCDRLRLDTLRRLTLPPGRANERVFAWRASLIDAGVAQNSINRRLACLRSFIKWARMAGVVPWTIEVSDTKAELTRDTRGPSLEVVRQMARPSLAGTGAPWPARRRHHPVADRPGASDQRGDPAGRGRRRTHRSDTERRVGARQGPAPQAVAHPARADS